MNKQERETHLNRLFDEFYSITAEKIMADDRGDSDEEEILSQEAYEKRNEIVTFILENYDKESWHINFGDL